CAYAVAAGSTIDPEAKSPCSVAVESSRLRGQGLPREGLVDNDVGQGHARRIEFEGLKVSRPGLRPNVGGIVQMHGHIHARPILDDVDSPKHCAWGTTAGCVATMVRCEIELKRVRRCAGTGDAGDECRDCETRSPRE